MPLGISRLGRGRSIHPSSAGGKGAAAGIRYRPRHIEWRAEGDESDATSPPTSPPCERQARPPSQPANRAARPRRASRTVGRMARRSGMSGLLSGRRTIHLCLEILHWKRVNIAAKSVISTPALIRRKQSGSRLDCRGASRLAMTVVYDRYRPKVGPRAALARRPLAEVVDPRSCTTTAKFRQSPPCRSWLP